MENQKKNLETELITTWPQAAVKSVELILNRSVIGAVFILFMVGVYYFAIDMRQIDQEQLSACMELLKAEYERAPASKSNL